MVYVTNSNYKRNYSFQHDSDKDSSQFFWMFSSSGSYILGEPPTFFLLNPILTDLSPQIALEAIRFNPLLPSIPVHITHLRTSKLPAQACPIR